MNKGNPTGLTDKHGNPIHEGDTVRCTQKVGVVEYINEKGEKEYFNGHPPTRMMTKTEDFIVEFTV